MDEAEVILTAAQAVIALRNRSLGEGEEEGEETHAVSVEFDESIEEEVEPNLEMTAEGYDEAVENGVPFRAESEISAWDSADPVSLTEADPIAEDELVLLEAGRDLRPDTITPDPEVTSSAVEAYESLDEVVVEVLEEENALDASADEAETSTPAVSEDAASRGSVDDDDENQ